jgi:hypothetical protein
MLFTAVGCGCSRATTTESAEQPSASAVWVEREPGPEIRKPVDDSSGWSGVWVEHFPGRPSCQDRFTLRVDGAAIEVESIDCTNGQPYHIFEIHWDGQTLSFVAEPPDSPVQLNYALEQNGPEQLVGTANEFSISWSRIE